MKLFHCAAAVFFEASVAYGSPILYTFNAVAPASAGSLAHSQTFQLIVPDFLPVVLNGPVAEFLSTDPAVVSCVPCKDPPVSALFFLRGGAGDSIQFQDKNGTGYFYLFAENVLSNTGTYETLSGINVNKGTLVVAAVPEPSTTCLLAMGLSGVALRLRIRRRRVQGQSPPRAKFHFVSRVLI
jgi:hypothetical protein